MNKSKVRCWQIENWRTGRRSPDVVLITYPENNDGHDLITCLNCGHVYSVSISKMVYVGPSLQEKMNNFFCVECSLPMRDKYSLYPNKYRIDGEVIEFERPQEIPSDSESIVREFDEIY